MIIVSSDRSKLVGKCETSSTENGHSSERDKEKPSQENDATTNTVRFVSTVSYDILIIFK